MSFLHTIRFHRGKLPHWEVEAGRYFITVRLADSLPRNIVLRLQEIHRSLGATAPQSTAFALLQRQFFRTMEKYLDAGAGACLLADQRAAAILVHELEALADWSVDVPHYAVMPNHCHALIVPRASCTRSLGEIMKRLKGRSANRIRATIGGSGPVWQREWFDRWIRHESEWQKTMDYIRTNPVNAGLVNSWPEHPWTR